MHPMTAGVHLANYTDRTGLLLTGQDYTVLLVVRTDTDLGHWLTPLPARPNVMRAVPTQGRPV